MTTPPVPEGGVPREIATLLDAYAVGLTMTPQTRSAYDLTLLRAKLNGAIVTALRAAASRGVSQEFVRLLSGASRGVEATTRDTLLDRAERLLRADDAGNRDFAEWVAAADKWIADFRARGESGARGTEAEGAAAGEPRSDSAAAERLALIEARLKVATPGRSVTRSERRYAVLDANRVQFLTVENGRIEDQLFARHAHDDMSWLVEQLRSEATPQEVSSGSPQQDVTPETRDLTQVKSSPFTCDTCRGTGIYDGRYCHCIAGMNRGVPGSVAL